MSDKRSGPVFNAGRDQHIAYAEEGNAELNLVVSNRGGPEEIDIVAELQAVREMLGRLPPQGAPAVALLDEAEREAKAAEPRRDEVASLVQGATKLAAGVNGFAEQADRLIPRLQLIAAWAGRAWDAWGPTLGF